MRLAAILALLALAACSSGAEFVGDVVTLPGVDTAGKILDTWGPPCWTDTGNGALLWHYCAERCVRTDGIEWCRAPTCERPCPEDAWVFHIIGGAVVHMDGPPLPPNGWTPEVGP